MPVGKNDESVHDGTTKTPEIAALGFSIPFWVGGLYLRLTTSYSSPSSHLQI